MRHRALGAPEELVSATGIAAIRTREPITVLVPLIWLAANEGRAPEVHDRPVPPSPIAGDVPLYALDMHTRLGREAIWRFARENGAVPGMPGASGAARAVADGGLLRGFLYGCLAGRSPADLAAVREPGAAGTLRLRVCPTRDPRTSAGHHRKGRN